MYTVLSTDYKIDDFYTDPVAAVSMERSFRKWRRYTLPMFQEKHALQTCRRSELRLELAKVKVSDLQVVLAVGTSRCQWRR